MGIEVKNLSYSYKNRENILNDISFSVEQGEYLCLLGPNGVGKSTLFKCMTVSYTHLTLPTICSV